MTIQFLDLRISSQDNSDAAPVAIPLAAAPLVFGDIGLQTSGVLAANQGLVRVLLTGYAKVVVSPQFGLLTLQIIRNDEATPIFSTTFGAADNLDNEGWGFSAVDFPSAALVTTGQIRYRVQIFAAAAGSTIGARNFSGTAAAGNFTG
ncbi:hypothetical protein ACFPYJ_19065 [Paenibacillus solisilvae]|uniref:Exosporium leader peptide n=1 Tax=Paenibacillus solisilvae TaxID=2486751 RepID=A0ABW0W2K8_9BACL